MVRPTRQVRRVSVHLLIAHEDLGLWKEPTRYPSLPDLSLYRRTTRVAARRRGDAQQSN